MVCMEIFPSSKSAAAWTKPNTETEGGYFQFVLLLFAVFRDIGNVATLQRQFHLRLLVLGTFVAL